MNEIEKQTILFLIGVILYLIWLQMHLYDFLHTKCARCGKRIRKTKKNKSPLSIYHYCNNCLKDVVYCDTDSITFRCDKR